MTVVEQIIFARLRPTMLDIRLTTGTQSSSSDMFEGHQHFLCVLHPTSLPSLVVDEGVHRLNTKHDSPQAMITFPPNRITRIITWWIDA